MAARDVILLRFIRGSDMDETDIALGYAEASAQDAISELVSSVGHTLGPWRVVGPYGNSKVEIAGNGPRSIATIWVSRNRVEDEANLRLILAAPDLADCLADLIDRLASGYGVAINDPAGTIAAIERAENLLAKLRGDQ